MTATAPVPAALDSVQELYDLIQRQTDEQVSIRMTADPADRPPAYRKCLAAIHDATSAWLRGPAARAASREHRATVLAFQYATDPAILRLQHLASERDEVTVTRLAAIRAVFFGSGAYYRGQVVEELGRAIEAQDHFLDARAWKRVLEELGPSGEAHWE